MIAELTLPRRQMELPLDPFETLGKRLLERTEKMCRLKLDMTLAEYHNQCVALVALQDEVCVLVRNQIKRLEACVRREQGKERRRAKEEIEKLRALLKDASAVIESRFLAATEPILAASEKYHDRDDEWFSNTISDARACEHIGHLTLRQIIEQYA